MNTAPAPDNGPEKLAPESPDTHADTPDPKVSTFGGRLRELAAGTANVASSTTKSALQLSLRGADTVRRGAEYAAAQSLSTLAGDTTIPPTVIARIIKVAPIVGAAQSYARAWAEFHRAETEGDLELKNQARAKCLIALAEAGIDVGTLGAARWAKAGGFVMRTFTFLSASRAIEPVDEVRTTLLGAMARWFITVPTIERTVDVFFGSVKPITKAPNGPSESSTSNPPAP